MITLNEKSGVSTKIDLEALEDLEVDCKIVKTRTMKNGRAYTKEVNSTRIRANQLPIYYGSKN